MGYQWLPGRFVILVDVEPSEVTQVLDGTRRHLARRVTAANGLPLVGILGRTASGRGLVVFVRHDDGLDWTIVGARPMTQPEGVEYEKWEAEQ